MLVIRSAQMRVLAEHTRRRYLRQLAADLAKYNPRTGTQPEEHRLGELERRIQRAETQGLTSASLVEAYLTCLARLEAIEPKAEAMLQPILENGSLSAEERIFEMQCLFAEKTRHA